MFESMRRRCSSVSPAPDPELLELEELELELEPGPPEGHAEGVDPLAPELDGAPDRL